MAVPLSGIYRKHTSIISFSYYCVSLTDERKTVFLIDLQSLDLVEVAIN